MRATRRGDAGTKADYVDELGSYTVQKRRHAAHRFFVHNNSLYSPQAVTDASGAVVERYAYDAYGRQTVMSGGGAVLTQSAVGMTKGYTGQSVDSETGLMYFRARMYSPGLGRFVNRDPAGFISGMSLYMAYFAVNGLDPSGLIDETIDEVIRELEANADSLLRINWKELARKQASEILDKAFDSAISQISPQGLDTSRLNALHQQYKSQLLSELDLRLGFIESDMNRFNAQVRSNATSVASYAFDHPGQSSVAMLSLTAAAVYAEQKTGTAILPKSIGKELKINASGLGRFSFQANAYRSGFSNFGASVSGFRFETRSLTLGSGVTITGFATCPATKISVSLKEKLNVQYGGETQVGLSVTLPGSR